MKVAHWTGDKGGEGYKWLWRSSGGEGLTGGNLALYFFFLPGMARPGRAGALSSPPFPRTSAPLSVPDD